MLECSHLALSPTPVSNGPTVKRHFYFSRGMHSKTSYCGGTWSHRPVLSEFLPVSLGNTTLETCDRRKFALSCPSGSSHCWIFPSLYFPSRPQCWTAVHAARASSSAADAFFFFFFFLKHFPFRGFSGNMSKSEPLHFPAKYFLSRRKPHLIQMLKPRVRLLPSLPLPHTRTIHLPLPASASQELHCPTSLPAWASVFWFPDQASALLD